MSREKVKLANSRMRMALKSGNGESIIESTMVLSEGNSDDAKKLVEWFSTVAKSCESKLPIDSDISMMRMWQLGNTDIHGISENGRPVFALTQTGYKKVKDTPKEKLFNALLMNHKYQTA